MSKAVVFSRPIKPEWLDKTVEFLLKCQDEERSKDMLLEFLSSYIKAAIILNAWQCTGL